MEQEQIRGRDFIIDKVVSIKAYAIDEESRLLTQLVDIYKTNNELEKLDVVQKWLNAKLVFELNPISGG